MHNNYLKERKGELLHFAFFFTLLKEPDGSDNLGFKSINFGNWRELDLSKIVRTRCSSVTFFAPEMITAISVVSSIYQVQSNRNFIAKLENSNISHIW